MFDPKSLLLGLALGLRRQQGYDKGLVRIQQVHVPKRQRVATGGGDGVEGVVDQELAVRIPVHGVGEQDDVSGHPRLRRRPPPGEIWLTQAIAMKIAAIMISQTLI